MKTSSLLVLSLLVAFAVAGAQPGPGPHARRLPLLEALNLTDQQKKDMEKIQSDAVKQRIDDGAGLAKARVELRQMLRAENPNQAALEKKMGEIAQMRSSLQARHLNTWFTVNKLLNAEQQKIWKKSLERRMMAAGQRFAMRGRMHRDGFRRFHAGPPGRMKERDRD